MPIRILDPAVVSRIAAGEVVERPASIVKELVENAVDAGATAVTVDLVDGGLRRIRVTDNGEGMDFDDAARAFLRHATSKIASAEDIESITTLGFRGEALYSIAAVAAVELTTRQQDAESGTLVRMEGTTLKDHRIAGSPPGTTVVVSNLFENTPARLKFMKKPGIEAAYAADIVIREMLSHPAIAFRFVSNGRTLYQTTGDGSLQNALLCIYGKELLGEMLEVEANSGDIAVSGIVGGPRIARPNRTRQSFFVNGRYVRSYRLSRAVEQAYGTRLMRHRYPLCALNIALDPAMADVNISPGKLEVRFRDEARLIAFVTDAVRDTLERAGTGFSAQAAPEEDASAEKGHGGQDIKEANSLPFGFEGRPPRGLNLREDAGRGAGESRMEAEGTHAVKTEQEGLRSGETAPGTKLPPYRLAGRLFDTYLVVEMGETVYIVDQHAAHERILFDKYCDLIKKGSIPSQQLLVPEVVTLTPQEFAQIEPALHDLVSLGFAIDLFGGHDVRVSALPFILGNARMEDFLKELSHAGVLSDPAELKREKIAKLACRSAIKAGDVPSEEELDALFGLVIQKGSAITCPHGRPVMIEMTKKSLEKTFGRIVV